MLIMLPEFCTYVHIDITGQSTQALNNIMGEWIMDITFLVEEFLITLANVQENSDSVCQNDYRRVANIKIEIHNKLTISY